MDSDATSTNSCGSTQSRKRNLPHDASSGSVKKFRCEPCDQDFTRHGSLLRHMRETKKHQQLSLDTIVELSCEICWKTFTRPHDLDRLREDQHPDGEISGTGCGTRIRQNTLHENCRGSQRATVESDLASESASANTSNARDLTQPHRISKEQVDVVMDSLTAQLKGVVIRSAPMTLRAYKKQVRTADLHRLLPCGICRMEFEITNVEKLIQHLKAHYESLNGSHRCNICEINFVHEADLSRHLYDARAGNCGFHFKHKEVCSGHHPPQRATPSSVIHETDDHRFNFAYRLRTWEHSKLKSFLSSLEPLIESKVLGVGAQMTAWSEGYRSVERSLAGMNRGAMSAQQYRHAWSMKCRTIAQQHPVQTHENAYGEPDYSADLGCEEFLRNMLHSAANSADIDLLAFALACDVDVNASTENGQTALHTAVAGGNSQVATLLLDAGADVNLTDSNREPPLMIAVRCKNWSVARQLVDHGALQQSPDHLIHAAFAFEGQAQRGLPDILEALTWLIEAGALVNSTNANGLTAVAVAAQTGYIEVLKMLLSNGADVTREPMDERSALSRAIVRQHHAVIEFLSHHEVAVSAQHVQEAIDNGLDDDIVARFVDRYTDATPAYKNILKRLIGRVSPDTLDYLSETRLRYDGIHQLATEQEFALAQQYILTTIAAECFALTAYLLSEEYAFRSIWESTQFRGLAVREALISVRASILQLFDRYWGTAEVMALMESPEHHHSVLCEAVSRGRPHSVLFILDLGVGIDKICACGSTGLIAAAKQRKTEIVECLLSENAKADIQDPSGHTALCFLASLTCCRQRRILKNLLKAGADLDACANYATKSEHLAMRLLRSK